MKTLTIIFALAASTSQAGGLSTATSDLTVQAPVCATKAFGLTVWKGTCNASRNTRSDSRDVVPVGGVNHTPTDGQPEGRPERHKPTDKASREIGNPGNDKSAGRAGEKPDKNMDERSPAGNRGRSN